MFCPFGQVFSAFALPQATLRSPAVIKIKPFGLQPGISRKDVSKKEININRLYEDIKQIENVYAPSKIVAL
jgi:hypothetical protein